MRTTKKIISIISMVLFIIIMFQSLFVGIGNAIQSNTDDKSGSAGVFVAFMMLIAGIIGICGLKSKGAGITSGIFYSISSLIGLTNSGTYGDLIVWSVVALIFGLVFIIGSVRMNTKLEREKKESEVV